MSNDPPDARLQQIAKREAILHRQRWTSAALPAVRSAAKAGRVTGARPLLDLRFRRRRPVGARRDPRAAADGADRLCRRQRRLSLRHQERRRRSRRGCRPCSAGSPSASIRELIVIACNTASTIALDAVRAALDLPIVGTVPAIKPAAALSKTRAIGVLGTEATVRPALCRPARRRIRRPTARSSATARPSWSSSPRRSCAARPATPAAYRRILDGLLAQPGGERIDTIVLACTHFPLVEDGARGRGAAPARLRRRQGGHRPPDRLADPRRDLAGRSRAKASPSSPAAAPDSRPIAPGLAGFGLTRIERL